MVYIWPILLTDQVRCLVFLVHRAAAGHRVIHAGVLADLAELVPDCSLKCLDTIEELLVRENELLDALILVAAVLLGLRDELLEVSLEFVKVLLGLF